MRAQADQVDLILFRVFENFPVGLALADCMRNLTPKVRFRGHRILKSSRRFVIGAVLAGRVPGYFRLSQAKRRQHVQQMQFGLVLLRERQTVVKRHLCVVRKVVGDEHTLESYFVTWLIYPVSFVAMHHEHWTGGAPADGLGGGTKQRRSMGASSRTHH